MFLERKARANYTMIGANRGTWRDTQNKAVNVNALDPKQQRKEKKHLAAVFLKGTR